MACRHSGRHVYVAFRCVFDCATIARAIRWGVALIGDYHYWALGPHFKCSTVTSGRRSLDAGIEKKAGFWLCYIFCKYIWVVFICIRVM